MTTAYTSLLGLALPVTGELSGTWGDTVNTAITSLLDTAVAGTTSITTDADITLTTTTGASNQARQAIILWNPASGTTTRNITAPAQSKMYTVINASGGTQSIVIRGVGPTTGVTVLKGESALVAWNGSDFVKVSSIGGSLTLLDLTVTGNTILGDAAADTLTVNATSTFNAPVSFAGQVKLPSTGRSAAAALTPTNPAFLYGVASTYTDTTSSGTLAPVASFYGLAQPTLSTSNVTTYTSAATLYIANAPTTGGSATITNPYALYVAAGTTYLAGNVGIGTSSPSNKLQVTDASAATIRLKLTANANGTIWNDNASTTDFTCVDARAMTFGTSNTERMRIDFSGNVGIGFSSGLGTYGQLEVGGNANPTMALRSSSGSGVIFALTSVGATEARINAISNVPMTFFTNNTERMRIDSSGNLGIGTASSTAKLSVNGGTSTSQIRWEVNNAAYVQEVSTNAAQNAYVYKMEDASYYTWKISGTEQMRLDSSGNLGIGTSTPQNKLNVVSSDSTNIVGASTAGITITNTYTGAFGYSSDLIYGVGGGAGSKLAGISGIYTN